MPTGSAFLNMIRNFVGEEHFRIAIMTFVER